MSVKEKLSPFDLNNDADYQQWKVEKLTDYPTDLTDLVVEIKDPFKMSDAEKDALISGAAKTNMMIYCTNSKWEQEQPLLTALMRQLGVTDLDHNLGAGASGLSALTPGGSAYSPFENYIPYRKAAIGWHTDGYYNSSDRQIRTLTLFCEQTASSGGENELLDHEMMYIWLRDKNPNYVAALMEDDVMMIPERLENGKVARPDRYGPVFSINKDNARLHMRYTDRTKSIQWKDDALTLEAVGALKQFLKTPSPYVFKGKLEAGWGLISNNVLHTRGAFEEPRKLYRARFFDSLSFH